jgi:hypothetical protein
MPGTQGALAPSEFTETTVGIHVYEAIASFEKGQRRARVARKTGPREAPRTRAQERERRNT